VVLMGVAFNTLNAWINARWVSHLGTYETTWLLDPRFLIGVAVFAWGMAINLRSDSLLRRLRKPGETGYKIPHGGLYRWVSCPNYLGEIIEWIGWAIATWSVAGLAFAVYTAANVGPRALSHHRWYRERFEDYPEERKALIPFVL
jgi:steroid 5-alpha reductase family enzyme